MAKIHLIYHQVKPGIDCPDGIMAAAVAYDALLKLDHQVTIEGACYRKEYPDRPDIETPIDCDRIVIVDFSFPASWIQWWTDCGVDVEILEHHKDKFPWLENFSGAILDENECGATLAWKRFHNGKPMPELLKHVRNRDIGSNGYYEGLAPESEAINLGLGEFRQALKVLPLVEQLLNLGNAAATDTMTHSFAIVGVGKIELRDRIIAEVLPKTELRTIDGIPCAFYDFTLDRDVAPHCSILGHRMCEFHGVQIAHMLDGRSNHLRSLKSFPECSRIAATKGGGGHPCASGWQS